MNGQKKRSDGVKVEVKEKEKHISMTQLFDGKAHELVPVTEVKKGRSTRKPAHETGALVETVKSKAGSKPEVTSPSVLKKNQKKIERDDDDRMFIPPIFYILGPIVAGILWFGLQAELTGGSSRPDAENPAPLSTGQLVDRVDYYRKTIGRKLNIERVGVEYENQVSAPRISKSAKKAVEPDMLRGLPLASEPHHRRSSRDRSEPINPDYADTRVQYDLREQELFNDWEKRSREAYIEQFIANAAKAGYRVKVDKSGVATVVGRVPTSDSGQLVLPPSRSGGGAMR